MKFQLLFCTLVFLGCSETKVIRCFPNPCSVEATVVDLRSLDGCDFVFELSDGTRLLPERRTYIQAPTKEADPVYHYQFVNGAKVGISYEESLALSACMAGRIVFVTCLSDLSEDR